MKPKLKNILTTAALTGLLAGCASHPPATSARGISAGQSKVTSPACAAKGECASKDSCGGKSGCGASQTKKGT